MSTLFCICSKSPNPFLYDCIANLYKFNGADIVKGKLCVVDSDSDNLTNYTKINNDFPDVEIFFIKNKNYEYGAWKYAYSMFPNYINYMCIQDTIITTNKVDFSIINNNNAYMFFDTSGYYSDSLQCKEFGITALKDSGLNYTGIIDTHFNLAQHSCFIVTNEVIKDIFNTLRHAPLNKMGSCSYERLFGLYFILKHINTHNLYTYCNKIHGGRN